MRVEKTVNQGLLGRSVSEGEKAWQKARQKAGQSGRSATEPGKAPLVGGFSRVPSLRPCLHRLSLYLPENPLLYWKGEHGPPIPNE